MLTTVSARFSEQHQSAAPASFEISLNNASGERRRIVLPVGISCALRMWHLPPPHCAFQPRWAVAGACRFAPATDHSRIGRQTGSYPETGFAEITGQCSRSRLRDNFTSRSPKTSDAIQCPPSDNFRFARDSGANRRRVKLVRSSMAALAILTSEEAFCCPRFRSHDPGTLRRSAGSSPA